MDQVIESSEPFPSIGYFSVEDDWLNRLTDVSVSISWLLFLLFFFTTLLFDYLSTDGFVSDCVEEVSVRRNVWC